MRLLNEHGDEIEADLSHFHNIDLVDFYRGNLSARRLGVLVRKLPRTSELSIALNDGEPPWGRLEHLVADLYKLWAGHDHPVRAEMEAKAHKAAKNARAIELRIEFEKRKRRYGLG